MQYVLALDQGTTSSRAVLYDRGGTIRSLVQREFGQIYPSAGWVEHDPEEIWASQMSVAVEALSRANSRPRNIAALGITNQRETTIVWERKTGKPVHNAIVWQDRRTAPICEGLQEQGLEEPAIRRFGANLLSEMIGTLVLVLVIGAIFSKAVALPRAWVLT